MNSPHEVNCQIARGELSRHQIPRLNSLRPRHPSPREIPFTHASVIGQDQTEVATLARFAFQFDVTSETMRRSSRDGQTQARPAADAIARLGRPIEPIEDPLLVFRCDSQPSVRYR